MMKNTLNRLLICVVCSLIHGISVMFAPALSAEPPGLVITADIQLAYADSLYKAGDHTAAQVEFKRFIHFFPDDPRIDEARFKTAMALYHTRQFHASAKRFNEIILASKEEDSYAKESYFMQSKAFLAMGNSGYAQVVLQNFLKLTDDAEAKDRVYLELARIHIRESMKLGNNGLDQAEKYLTLISPANRSGYKVERQLSTIDKARSSPKKDPTLAGILAIIPGGGMLYCERYKDAFVSFCLNAGLIYAAYEAFNHDNPALGGVISFVGAGFYAGNIYGSVGAAHKYNEAARIRVLNREFNMEAGIDPFSSSLVLKLTHSF